MGTDEFLKELNYDQLKYARKKADELITAIDNESKVKLWIVSNGGTNEAAFYEHEFEKAKEKLCEVIMNENFKPMDVRSFYPQIHKHVVAESEVAGWMEINT